MTKSRNPSSVVEDEWYRQIVEAAPDAAVVIDSNGLIILINQQTEKLFGYERDELLNQAIEVLIPERFRSGHHIHRDGYFTEPNVREMGAGLDLYGVKKDGTEIPVEISLSPLRTKAGVFATASIRDATSRRRAEDQFKNLLETAPDAMIIINKEGNIMLVNAQAETMFGYHRDALIGKPVEVLVPEELRSRHLGHRKGYFVGPKVREMGAGLELSGRRKDGSTFPIEISLSPLETEAGSLATAAVRDISDRKKAEEQFRNLLETAPDAMIIIDKAGKITLVNRQTEQVFGYQRDELIGQPVEILVPEHLRHRHVGHRDGYFGDPKVREMGAGLELSGRRKNGEEFPIEISLSPLDTQDGRFATAAVRDITDRQVARTKLTEYARSLEASNRELEEFAYVASHDLQAPLRNIISFSELLREETQGKISEDADQYFNFIEEGGLRMQALIKDILEVSRVNRVDREFEKVDAEVCAQACVEALKANLDEANGTVEIGKLPMVKGDGTRITQLLQNLINNAIKFHAPSVAPIVKISAERNGEFWEFSVADNGIGIEEDELPQVFEIFRRLHTADEYPGTGIGLSICKKIVEAHGGHMRATSTPGAGTTFYFTLPDAYTILPHE